MSVTYVIDTKEKLIRTTCVGNVTLNEVTAHFRTLERDPNCPDILDVFLDLSETTSLPLSGQISAVAVEISRIKKKVQFNTCAVVATRNALFGMLRMFSVVAAPYFTAIRVFRVASEAEEWLASQKSLAK
jgi:hypothetical protein